MVGVTTAATLWVVTVIGLCFGGGQIWLGVAATAISLAALWVFKEAEKRMRRERRAALYLEMNRDGPADASLRQMIEATGLKIASECLLSLMQETIVRWASMSSNSARHAIICLPRSISAS